jgi:hypothetical protein
LHSNCRFKLAEVVPDAKSGDGLISAVSTRLLTGGAQLPAFGLDFRLKLQKFAFSRVLAKSKGLKKAVLLSQFFHATITCNGGGVMASSLHVDLPDRRFSYRLTRVL